MDLKEEKEDQGCQRYPVCFWDINGKRELPLRTTISEMRPMRLSRGW